MDDRRESKLEINFPSNREIRVSSDDHEVVEKTHDLIMRKLKNLRIVKRMFFRPDKKTVFEYKIKGSVEQWKLKLVRLQIVVQHVL